MQPRGKLRDDRLRSCALEAQATREFSKERPPSTRTLRQSPSVASPKQAGLPPEAQTQVVPNETKAAEPVSSERNEPSAAVCSSAADNRSSRGCWLLSLQEARRRWQAQLDEAIWLEADSQLGQEPQKLGLPVLREQPDQARAFARDRATLPGPAPLPPMARKTSLIGFLLDKSVRAAAEPGPPVAPADAEAQRVIEGPSGAKQSWARRRFAELGADLVLVLLTGVPFALQLITFIAIGPGYESEQRNALAGTFLIVYGHFVIAMMTSFSFVGFYWIGLPCGSLLVGSEALRRAVIYRGIEYWQPDPQCNATARVCPLTVQETPAGLYYQEYHGNRSSFMAACAVAILIIWMVYLVVGCGRGWWPRLKRCAVLAIVMSCLGFISFRVFVRWDIVIFRAWSKGTGRRLLRPALVALTRGLFVALSNFAAQVWPVQEAREKMMRAFGAMTAPLRLLAVTGCTTWGEFVVLFLLDYASVGVEIMQIFALDNAHRALSGSSPSRLVKWIVALDPYRRAPVTETWPQGEDGAACWRRFVTMTRLQSTAGATVSALLALAVANAAAHIGATPTRSIQTWQPAGATSICFLAILGVSQLLQDALFLTVAVKEKLRRSQVLTSEMRQLLAAKMFPPIFSSRAAFWDFAVPFIVASGFTSPYAYSPVDTRYYACGVQHADGRFEEKVCFL